MLKIIAFSTETGALGVIHSTNISRNFRPKLNRSVWSNRKSFEKTGPRFEVDHLIPGRKFWLNGLCPVFLIFSDNRKTRKTFFLLISIMLLSRESDQLRVSSHNACFQVSNSVGLLHKSIFSFISWFVYKLTLVF